nr:TIGR04211 family SH3 domain-containing protein [Pseudomonas duriflava]
MPMQTFLSRLVSRFPLLSQGTRMQATRTRFSTYLLSAALLGGLGQAHAQENAVPGDRWVSDTLSTYVRSGPTDGYRIVGALKSGQKVELVSTQGDYSQIRGEGGDLVWIRSSDLQEQPGPREYVPQLQQQVNELSAQLKTIDDGWKSRVQGMQETLEARKARIDELEDTRRKLDNELTEAQSELRSVKARLGDENQDALMRYFVYGGSIAGAGLLAGLILPSFAGRRKRNDRWF